MLPTAEVVADFDIGTLPWVYLRHGGIYDMVPALHTDPEEQEEVVAMLDVLTGQAGVSDTNAIVTQMYPILTPRTTVAKAPPPPSLHFISFIVYIS